MTEDPSSEAVVRPTFAPALVPSSPSSGDEGGTHLRRRWSVDGGQTDVSSQSVASSSFTPTLDIPSQETCVPAAVHSSSTPPSPSKQVNLDVNAMFQCNGPSDAIIDAPLGEEEDAEASAAAVESRPDDAYSELSASLSSLSKVSLPSLQEELLAWANQSREESDGHTLSAIVDLVFKAAIDNAAKSELYAQLCHSVMDHFDPDLPDDQTQDADSDVIPRPQIFRRYLINRCQDEFEQGLSEEADPSPNASQQFVGAIKFIGELLNAKVLKPKMVHHCIETILAHSHFESAEPGRRIDALDVLLTTCGRSLDSRKARERMDVYFADIQALSLTSEIPVHQRKLQALIELRRSWKTKPVAHPPPVADDGVWGHPLGEMSFPSHSRSQRPPHADPYDPWQSAGTEPEAVPLGTGELPPPPIMSESDAMLRAEKNSTDFLFARDIAAAEKHFEQFPSGHLHLLVHALVDKAILYGADASLVAALFDSVAATSLCPPATFEEGFTPTAKHLAGMLKDVPDALESYARMFKGAGLGADEELCMRIAGMLPDSDELLLLLFSPIVSTDSELTESSEPSSSSPKGLEPATAAPLSSPSSGWSEVMDEEAPSSVPAPPYNADSVRQSSGAANDDDDLYADYTDLDNRTIQNSHLTPAPAVFQQRRADRQVPTTQPVSSQTLRKTNRIHVEERIPEPPSPPMSDSPILPLARVRMSQTEANERIERTFAQLFGGPHDIEVALSVFAAVPARHHGRLVDRLVSFATESTPGDAQLVAYFFYCAAAQGLCTPAAFEAGFAVTAAGLEEVAAESSDAVLLFATMARGAGLHKDADWRRRALGRLESLGYGRDLASLSSSV